MTILSTSSTMVAPAPFAVPSSSEQLFPLPSSWDSDSVVMQITDEELSATSDEEACKVFEQWTSEDDLKMLDSIVSVVSSPSSSSSSSHDDLLDDNDDDEEETTATEQQQQQQVQHHQYQQQQEEPQQVVSITDGVDSDVWAVLAGTKNHHDDQDDDDDCSSDLDIMEVDEQLGANLLGDDFFSHDPCLSPTGPLEELVFMNLGADGAGDLDRFSLSLLSNDDDGSVCCGSSVTFFATPSKVSSSSSATTTPDAPSSSSQPNVNDDAAASVFDTTSSFLPFAERYQATLQKLSESMKRSQETRKALTMSSTTMKTEEYSRTSSVVSVLTSIEESSQQLQDFLNKNASLSLGPRAA